MLRFCASCVPIALLAGVATGNEVSTSFEFTDLTGSFTLGTNPRSVTFEHGLAQANGNPELRRTGTGAWMIEPRTTGEITFITPAASIDLWFRDEFAANRGVLRFFDSRIDVALRLYGTRLETSEPPAARKTASGSGRKRATR